LRNKAIALLACREHSRFELKQKLELREFENDAIEKLLDDLEIKNLLSDQRFAEMYVRNRKNAGYGPKKIIAELQVRGIADHLISSVIDENSETWRNNMIVTAAKKHANKEQLFRFLLHRGYSSEVINQWLRII